MGEIKTLVWDFDGTQGKTLELLVSIGHKLSPKYVGFDFIDEDVEYLRGLNAKEVAKSFFTGDIPSMKNQKVVDTYIERFVPNFRLQWKIGISLPRILKEGQADFHEEHETIQPYDGIVDIIKELSAKDYENITLTSNHKEIIYKIYSNWNLHCVEVYHCTTFLGLPSLFGKTNELKKIMKERSWRKPVGDIRQKDYFEGYQNGIWKYDTSKLLYIGDEARDVHACQKLGVQMIGVTWGLNNREALLKAGLPEDHLVDSPNDIPKKIEYISQKAV